MFTSTAPVTGVLTDCAVRRQSSRARPPSLKVRENAAATVSAADQRPRAARPHCEAVVVLPDDDDDAPMLSAACVQSISSSSVSLDATATGGQTGARHCRQTPAMLRKARLASTGLSVSPPSGVSAVSPMPAHHRHPRGAGSIANVASAPVETLARDIAAHGALPACVHRDSIALWLSQCRSLLARVRRALVADNSTSGDATNAIVALLRLPRRGGRKRLRYKALVEQRLRDNALVDDLIARPHELWNLRDPAPVSESALSADDGDDNPMSPAADADAVTAEQQREMDKLVALRAQRNLLGVTFL